MKQRPLKVFSFTGEGRVLPHTLRDVQDSMRRMGHEVQVLDMRKMSRFQRLVAFSDMLVFHRPDVLFTIDVTGLLPFLIAVLPQPPQVITWFYDNPLRVLSAGFLQINHALAIHVWDQEYVEPVREMGFSHVNYQPFATDTSVNHPMKNSGEQHDVSFVGAWSETRERWLSALAAQGIEISIFGDGAWEQVSCPGLFYEGYASNRVDCPRIYGASKINLNITSDQLLSALPVRVFDVLACEGFLITDYRADVERLFVPGQELVVGENAEVMGERIRYYLEHEDERRRIAAAGRKRVCENYTFDQVVPRILSRTQEMLCEDESTQHPGHAADYARAAWLIGMSALKSGDYQLAAQLLCEVLKLCENDDIVVVSLCILAARVGDVEQLEGFLGELRKRKSRWIAHEAAFHDLLQGKEFVLWNEVYREFFNIEAGAV